MSMTSGPWLPTPEPPARPPRSTWLGRLPRWFVGLVLVATGTGKALDISGFAHVLSAYELMPVWGNVLLAHTLPFIELSTGLLLLLGFRVRSAASLSVALHMLLLSAAVFTLWRGIALANCGCFGVFLARPLTGQTVVEDAVMLGLSLLVRWQARPAVEARKGFPWPSPLSRE